MSGHIGNVSAVTWSPDGMFLATGSIDTTAKVWDATSGRELLTLSGHRAGIRTIAWSRDSKRLATGSWDGTAKVWNTSSGQELLALNAIGISGVSWSADGKRLASGGPMTMVWDAEEGHRLFGLYGRTDSAGGVAWSPDGKRLAAVSTDGIVQVYTMDIRDLMELARRHVRALQSGEDECKAYFHNERCPPVPNLPWW